MGGAGPPRTVRRSPYDEGIPTDGASILSYRLGDCLFVARSCRELGRDKGDELSHVSATARDRVLHCRGRARRERTGAAIMYDSSYSTVVRPARLQAPAPASTPPPSRPTPRPTQAPAPRAAAPSTAGPAAAVAPPARNAGTALPQVSSSDIQLIGVYEISKILTAPQRLEITLSNVVNLLSSFLRMRRGLIALLGDDDVPPIAVGAHWSPEAAERYRDRLPERAIGEIVVTGAPVVVQDIAAHPAFADADLAALGAGDGVAISFVGVPIRIEDKVVGTLTIDRVRDGSSIFRLDSDVRFLTMAANLIGQTVQLQRIVARDRERLMEESHRLQKQVDALAVDTRAAKRRIGGIVGDSPVLRALLDKVAIVARTHSTLLLRGESGTGKELFARAIHEFSPRADKAFVKLNCAALPESVLESELFGHEKGAFTGAVNFRKGRFELADGGTLFLDEIGEISPAFQAKLLRVLQEGEFERVGGARTLKVDVRIVAATNKNLEEAVANGEFRADLYYRINVVPLILPPLRERRGDIPALAAEFLKRFNAENGRSLSLSAPAMQLLQSCLFPGNVRELENCVRRTATLARGTAIGPDDFACRQDQCLSSSLWKGITGRAPAGLSPLPIHPVQPAPRPAPIRPAAPTPVAPAPEALDANGAGALGACACATKDPTITSCPPPGGCSHASARGGEKERLVEAMDRAGWVQAKAARILGLTPRQIGYALRKHGIDIQRF
jgi:Nif-specific regulatory protein